MSPKEWRFVVYTLQEVAWRAYEQGTLVATQGRKSLTYEDFRVSKAGQLALRKALADFFKKS